MPDLVNPLLTQTTSIPDIPEMLDTSWVRPTVKIPEILTQSQSAFPPGQVSPGQFAQTVNAQLTPLEVQQKKDEQAAMSALSLGLATNKVGPEARHFSSQDALRYKQNNRLWSDIGFNPEVPQDITDAMYDHHETKWESFKNIVPKLWSTSSFAFTNYFAEYADAARAVTQVDANLLHSSSRFDIYANEQKELEALNPDYKTDEKVMWHNYLNPLSSKFGDAWEESASSLGFTIGTIGAAVAEGAVLSVATGGFGEIANLPNSGRKVFKAISDYYSLKRAYGLIKGVMGPKSALQFAGSIGNIWRLTNGALSEAAFEGATASQEYQDKFVEDFIAENGYAPDDATRARAKKAGDEMAMATIKFQTPFLMASNAVQFGNLIAPKTIAAIQKHAVKAAAKVGVNLSDDAYKLVNQGAAGGFKTGVEATAAAKGGVRRAIDRVGGAARNSLWEGTEESYQGLVTKSTADYYNDKYFNKDDQSIMKSLGTGFDYVGSNEGLKEFAAGFATGSIFKAVGTIMNRFSKPSLRSPEDAKKFEDANPQASETEKKYKLNFLNKTFKFGMDKINKEIEREGFEKIAATLNQVDLDKFLRADGFLDMVKDKSTALALAKYIQNNDMFNMRNAQNLQLNRFLFNGLSTGKIDMQIDKLTQFAQQDFDTLKDYFALDPNDYQTKADQDAFVASFQDFAGQLKEKSKEFEKIYEQQKNSFGTVMSQVAKEVDLSTRILNFQTLQLKAKYNVTTDEELEKVLTAHEKSMLIQENANVTEATIRFHATNEALKASVFSQAGMAQSAQAARDLVRDLKANSTTGHIYTNLGDMFTEEYRNTQEKNLDQKLELAKANNDPALPVIQAQVDAFNKINSLLTEEFAEAKETDINEVAKALQDYYYSIQREINRLDNTTPLDTRIQREQAEQLALLKDWARLQKQHQENLNLNNYLANVANRQEYANYQSKKLKDFFAQASALAEEEKKEAKAAATVAVPAAAIVDPNDPPLPPPPPPPAKGPDTPASPAPTAPIAPPAAPQNLTVLFSLIYSDLVKSDFDKLETRKKALDKYSPDEIRAAEEVAYNKPTFVNFRDQIREFINDYLGAAPPAATAVTTTTPVPAAPAPAQKYVVVEDPKKGFGIALDDRSDYYYDSKDQTYWSKDNAEVQAMVAALNRGETIVFPEKKMTLSQKLAGMTATPGEVTTEETTPSGEIVEGEVPTVDASPVSNTVTDGTLTPAEPKEATLTLETKEISVLDEAEVEKYKRWLREAMPLFEWRTNNITPDTALAERLKDEMLADEKFMRQFSEEERTRAFLAAGLSGARGEVRRALEWLTKETKPSEVIEETPSETKRKVHEDFNRETGLNTKLVGSVSRGEAKEGSDIDIVLDGMPHTGLEKITTDQMRENSEYAYDTLRSLAEQGIITHFEIKPDGFGVVFKYKGQDFQVVPNPSAPGITREMLEKAAKPDEVNRKREEFIKKGLIPAAWLPMLQRDAREGFRFIAQQINNLDTNGNFNSDTDNRNSDTILALSERVRSYANSLYPEYEATADAADAVATQRDLLEPQRINELPPSPPDGNDEGGSFTLTLPTGRNPITWLIDKAKEMGIFRFDTVNPKEIATWDKGAPALILKSANDKMAYKHRKVMDFLGSEFAGNAPNSGNYKIKLEFAKDNMDYFFKRDEKNNALVAMLVDDRGKYIYFDQEGNVTDEENGEKFGMEYEDNYYNEDKLNMSRDFMASSSQIGSPITSNYGKETKPLMTILTMLANKITVYGKIMGITNGTLSTFDNNNKYNNKDKPNTFKRTVKELYDNNEINGNQDFDIKIDGYYIGYRYKHNEQRVKVGKPSIFDSTSGLYIPLEGRALKDVTFDGTKITKDSKLGEIIEILDKTGSISVDTLRPDKTRILDSKDTLRDVFNFLRLLLYSEIYELKLSPDNDTIELARNLQTPKVRSLWDAQINYMAKGYANIEIPFTQIEDEQGNELDTYLNYQEFLDENFTTGVVPAEIGPDEKRYAKLNRRAILEVDMSHQDMVDKLAKDGQVAKPSTGRPEVGERYTPTADENQIPHLVVAVEEDEVTLKVIKDDEEADEDIFNITIKNLNKKWLKLPDIADTIKIEVSATQKEAARKIKPIGYTKSLLSVSSIPRAKVRVEGEYTGSAATVAGHVIDHIAKNVFDGNIVRFSDKIVIKETGKPTVTAPISEYFVSEPAFDLALARVKMLKAELEERGYIFKTGVRVYDAETGIGGEIDMVAISPEGEAMIYDFKSSKSSFDETHLAQDWNTGVSEKQYFATQGYVYGLMLAKQTGLPVSKNIGVLGLPISYTTGASIYDTKIVELRGIAKHELVFTAADIAPSYLGMKELPDIARKYDELIKQEATTPQKLKDDRRPRKGGSLSRVILEGNLPAASTMELRDEIKRMSEMLGEDMVVKFEDMMNKYEYGVWTINGTTLYKNAIAGTGFHEGWHQFSQLYLTEKQKISLYDSIRKEGVSYTDREGVRQNTLEHNDLEIEEFLADEWAKYAQSPRTYQYPGKQKVTNIMSLFRRLWQLIKEFFNPDKSPTKLFSSLYTGKHNLTPDVNNAIFGGLNASIVDRNGGEILNHMRTPLYKEATSYFIGQVLSDKGRSFSWLRDNANHSDIKNLVYDKFLDLEETLKDKLDARSTEIINDPEGSVQHAVNVMGLKENIASMHVKQLQEIYRITDEGNGAWDAFFNWYMKNSDIDGIVDTTGIDIENRFDTQEIREIMEREGDLNEDNYEDEDEEAGMGSKGERYGEGPNNSSAFDKASKDIKDFFRTMPIVESINPDGSFNYSLNELGLPYTHDYAAIFNKVKTLLAGKFTIESIVDRLNDPIVLLDFPQAKYIAQKLQIYRDVISPQNLSFLTRFKKIISLSEVDNRKLYVNFDNLHDMSAKEKTIVRSSSLSRAGEMAEIETWAHAFTRVNDRPHTPASPEITMAHITQGKDKANILYSYQGIVRLNPFYDWKYADEQMSSKEFLSMMGIKLNDTFWIAKTSILADRLKSLFIKDLLDYQVYLKDDLKLLYPKQTIEEILGGSGEPLGNEGMSLIYTDRFITNPINLFRERRTFSIGKKGYDTLALYTALEDVSRQNSVFSLTASSRSFTDGAGKMKWPFYNSSVMTYRTQLLNDIQNIRDFDKNEVEYESINPNKSPWLRHSLFYKSTFDNRGKRFTTSKEHNIARTKEPLSQEKVAIELADLSSFQTVANGKYTTVHPTNLSGQDKLFFDITTLLQEGFIEIPRAGTSGSVMAIKLNAYEARRQGEFGFNKQYLPMDITTRSVFASSRFQSIMNGYLQSELEKMKFYFNRNPNPEVLVDKNGKALKIDEPARNYYAHNFNIFKDIIKGDLAKKIISEAQAAPAMDPEATANLMKAVIDANLDQIKSAITSYFANYAATLYNHNDSKSASLMKMSDDQKKVVKSLLNLYQDKSKSTDQEDLATENEIVEILQDRGTSSVYQRAKTTSNQKVDQPLTVIAALFVANQFILNVEYQTWYMGDNYLFTTPFKRGNLTTNTGDMANVSPELDAMLNELKGQTLHNVVSNSDPKKYKNFRHLRTYILKDAKVKSKYFERMVQDIVNWEKVYNPSLDTTARTKELEVSFASYKSINAADGQSKMSLDAYRTLRRIYGNWNEELDEKEYQRQVAILRSRKDMYGNLKGQSRDIARERDLALIKAGPRPDGSWSEFNPQKFSYTGPEVAGNTPMRTKFDKTSFHPLIPEMLVGSNSADEDLMMQMAQLDVDYVKFQSASKAVKHGSVIDFFDEQGNKKADTELADYQEETLLSSYLKNQLSTDGMHADNIFGSQQRVMFFDVKYQPEVQNNPELLQELTLLEDEYLRSIGRVMDFQKKNFLNRFGIEESGKGQLYEMKIVNMERFAGAVNHIAKRDNFPENMKQYLKYDPAKKEYSYDPSLVFNRKMLIDTIGGMIDSDLRRMRTKGTAAIQVTQMGNTSHKFEKPTKEQLEEHGTAGLHYYHIKYENGKPVKNSTMGIKITMQGDFENLLNLDWNGRKIKSVPVLNKAMQDPVWKAQHIQKLTFLGYRIPTNNNNFIDHVEVMEFLPKSTGNIVIAPLEHIIKSGSDFDVDKLNFVFPAINSKGELTSRQEITRSIDQIYDELNKITPSIEEKKREQRDIKNIMARVNKNYKEVNKNRNSIGERIRWAFAEINSGIYQAMEDREASFQEMRDYFEPLVSDETIEDLRDYDILSSALKEEDLADSKVDNNFKSLMRELNSYKDSYINDMLEVQKRTLSNPAYYKIMISPSNTDYLLSEAERIGKLTKRTVNDGLSSTSNMGYTAVNDKFTEFLQDAKALGGYSIQRRWFSLLNYAKMFLNRKWTYNKNPMYIHTPLATADQASKLGDTSIINLYGQNLEGKNVNDIWDQFMSLTIDLPSNTSYTLFGINNINKKLVQYLITSRYPISMIMSFINQPVLQEVYDLWAWKSKEFEGYTMKIALLETAKEYGIKGGDGKDNDFSTIYHKLWNEDEKTGRQTTPNEYTKNPGIAANIVLNSNPVEFTQEELDNDIVEKKNKNTNAEYKKRQQNVLLYFMNAHLEATEFSKMQFAFSEDRNKNTNYFTIAENDLAKQDLRGSEENDLEVSNSMFSKAGLTTIEKNSIYTPFKYGTIASLFYETFAGKFTETAVADTISAILKNTNTFGIDRQLLATRIEGDFVEFIYKNFANFAIEVYDPFTDTLQATDKSFSDYFRQGIFNVNQDPDFKNYGEKLNAMLRLYPELENIPFVNKLFPESRLGKEKTGEEYVNDMDKYDYTVLRFKRSENNTISERNHFSSEFENLISFNPDEFRLNDTYTEEDKQKISSFFTELAYLTLYQSGPTNVADNFSDLIPTAIWEEFSSGAFSNFQQRFPISTAKNELMKIFHMLYVHNNPKVDWKMTKMYYNLNYFNTKVEEKLRSVANKSRKPIAFINHYRAGKDYNVNAIINKHKWTGVDNLKC